MTSQGVKALRKLQVGLETTQGTAVAATLLWRGVGTIQDNREIMFPEEDVGYLSGVDRSYTAKLEGGISFDDTEVTYEHLPYVLVCGVKDVTTGSADGSGSGKIYAYTFPTTSANTIKTLTIEGGDNQQAEEMEHAFVTAFTIAGAPGEALKVNADWVGRQVQTTTYTGSLSPATVEEAVFSKGTLYIDDADGTMGTTEVSSSLLGFTLSVETGWKQVYTANGNLYFDFIKSTQPVVSLDITFEHNSSAVSEIANWRNETARMLRLRFVGSAFTTAGTLYSNKTLSIDLAGKWQTFSKIDEQDGNDIVTGTFNAKYNATAEKFAEITVVNTTASL